MTDIHYSRLFINNLIYCICGLITASLLMAILSNPNSRDYLFYYFALPFPVAGLFSLISAGIAFFMLNIITKIPYRVDKNNAIISGGIFNKTIKLQSGYRINNGKKYLSIKDNHNRITCIQSIPRVDTDPYGS